MSATPLRRSARIASRNASRVVPSAPLKAPRPVSPVRTTRMSDVDIDMQILLEMIEDEKYARKHDVKRVQHSYLKYIEKHPWLFDFIEEEDLRKVTDALYKNNDVFQSFELFSNVAKASRRIKLEKKHE